MNDELETFRTRSFMRSRIPAQDALEAFVPTGEQPDAEMKEVMGRTGFSRWYPMDGGHRLRHATIEPGTLCWVTRDDPFVLLDEKCYHLAFGGGASAHAN